MKQTNDNLETILYNIIAELSKEKAPIVFKGALALKYQLYINNPNLEINRKTTDIDANWVEKYDENKIINIIDSAVKQVDSNYKVRLYRKPEANVSMGINILDENEIIVSKIDMDIKDNPFYVVCNIDDVDIKYSDFNKMMCDKLRSLSSEFVFRRVKDLLDVYLIISENNISKSNIEKVLKYENKKIGNFSTLLKNKEKIRQGYEALKYVDNKPEFDIVWNNVINYLEEEKFIDKNLEKNRNNNYER